MPEMLNAEELRQRGLAKHRGGNLDEALELYDAALTEAGNDELRELITINKADVLIEAQRTGPEVQALPLILMRRRNQHHTFLAAYQMAFKHRVAGELERAIFYGQIAEKVAIESDKAFWKIAALNELGIAYETNSQFTEAIRCFEDALPLLESLPTEERTFTRPTLVENLGCSRLLNGEIEHGLELIHSVLDELANPWAKAESLIDLCYGYLELQQFERAFEYGNAGLDLAAEPRQIRNAHYLLGEAAYKIGDFAAADFHFEELARFYPQFRNLKSLLYAIDLRSMLNLKL